MRAETRTGKDATKRRTQPNWFIECIRAGIPLKDLPTSPAAEASFKEKSQYTWALRKLWTAKTGRTIERLTPPGFNDALVQKRRLEREATRRLPQSVVNQIISDTDKQR